MMDYLWRLMAIALIATVFTVLLKKTSPDMALLLQISFCAVTVFLLVDKFHDIVSRGKSIAETMNLPVDYFVPIIKIIAIAIISKVCADICRDADETAIGNIIETAGAFAAILLTLPLFTAAWELLQELL